jgi:hypothetical protein
MAGGSIRIIPEWSDNTVTIIDISWDPAVLSSDLPKGPWWGDLAKLARTGSNEGEWVWNAAVQQLLLSVPDPVPDLAIDVGQSRSLGHSPAKHTDLLP